MIESLHLKGFQKHTDFFIEFDPNITVIVGPSDVGKSSIIRALRWLALGGGVAIPQPVSGGDAYVEARVDGRRVARRYGSENVYYLGETEFRAFRSAVPDEIQEFLRIGQVNFQNQHGDIYWLSSTPGEVSRALNQVVSLEIIDEVLGRANKLVAERRIQMATADREAVRAYKEYAKDAWVSRASKHFAFVAILATKVDEKEQDFVVLENLITNANRAYDNIFRYHGARIASEKILKAADASMVAADERDRLGGLLSDLDKYRAVVSRGAPSLSVLASAAGAVNTLKRRREEINSVVKQATKLQEVLKNGVPNSEVVSEFYECARDARARRKALSTVIDEIEIYESRVKTCKKTINEVEGKISTLKTCETCGQLLP